MVATIVVFRCWVLTKKSREELKARLRILMGSAPKEKREQDTVAWPVRDSDGILQHEMGFDNQIKEMGSDNQITELEAGHGSSEIMTAHSR